MVHEMHSSASRTPRPMLSLYCPSEQSAHPDPSVLPVAPLPVLPLSQPIQLVAWVSVTYWPVGHSTHSGCPTVSWNWPATQAMQSDAAVLPGAVLNLPTSQPVQPMACTAELYWPAGHRMHCASPSTFANCPATHAVQPLSGSNAPPSARHAAVAMPAKPAEQARPSIHCIVAVGFATAYPPGYGGVPLACSNLISRIRASQHSVSPVICNLYVRKEPGDATS